MDKIAKKAEIKKALRVFGHINNPNVGSKNSECITLTCSIKNVPSVAGCSKLHEELDDVTGQSGTVNIEIIDANTEDETINMKYKIKKCSDYQSARDIKATVDKYIKKKGGQTVIDEDFIEEEQEEAAKAAV